MAVIQAILILCALALVATLVSILHSLAFAYAMGFLTCVVLVYWLRKHGWPS